MPVFYIKTVMRAVKIRTECTGIGHAVAFMENVQLRQHVPFGKGIAAFRGVWHIPPHIRLDLRRARLWVGIHRNRTHSHDFLSTCQMRCFDNMGVDQSILDKRKRLIAHVAHDPGHIGRGMEDMRRGGLLKPRTYSLAVGQIAVCAMQRYNCLETIGAKTVNQPRPSRP